MTSTKSHTNYERFGQFNEPIASTNTDYHATDFEETPNESGVMIHVVDTNKGKIFIIYLFINFINFQQ